MEYAYATLLLNESNEEINETNLTAVLEASGHTVETSRVKALVAALEGVDLDDAALGEIEMNGSGHTARSEPHGERDESRSERDEEERDAEGERETKEDEAKEDEKKGGAEEREAEQEGRDEEGRDGSVDGPPADESAERSEIRPGDESTAET